MKRSLLLIIFLSILSLSIQAKLIDKIYLVIDDQIVTLSQIKRIQANLNSRKNVSPQIYAIENSEASVIESIIRTKLMRDKLSEMGYVIGDDKVNEQIENTESHLNLNRSQLLDFLSNNNLTFNEYFSVIKSTIEYNLFQARVVVPLVSVTEQQIKNTFYKKNSNNKTFSFKYNLVDFYVPKESIAANKVDRLDEVLKNFQSTGILPEEYSKIENTNLGDVSEEGFTENVTNLLKNTDEGAFSKAILINNIYHVFYVKKKDLTESDIFLKAKEEIRRELFDKESVSVMNIWFERQKNKHYIKIFSEK
ncbi:MAG: hypothetical protein U0T83_07655 [Bacteriovoracaceae bacterium]